MIRNQWFTVRRIGLAATILLMPGGFILGGALLAKSIDDRRKKRLKEKEGHQA